MERWTRKMTYASVCVHGMSVKRRARMSVYDAAYQLLKLLFLQRIAMTRRCLSGPTTVFQYDHIFHKTEPAPERCKLTYIYIKTYSRKTHLCPLNFEWYNKWYHICIWSNVIWKDKSILPSLLRSI
jgi:hypothetical protein